MIRCIASIVLGTTLLVSSLAAEESAVDALAPSDWPLADSTATETPATASITDDIPAGEDVSALLASFDEQDENFTLTAFERHLVGGAWSKGNVQIVPYGVLWGSALYVTRRTSPGPYTFFVLPLEEEGEEAFTIDTRRTRLGVDVLGPWLPNCGCAQIGGKIEIDFHGSFVIENKPGILLRHAYGELKNDQFRLLAGQTWDVISPLNPGTLSYSVLWAQGNIGFRRAQVRIERYFAMPAERKLTMQFSLNQDIVSDFTAEPGVDRESSGWPLVQGRIAFTDSLLAAGPMTLGVSGHIGEQGFDFTTTGPPPLSLPPVDDARIQTWSVNLDLYVPLTKRAGMQGEIFYGKNLSTFLGGVLQGVCPCTRRGIRSHGGWVDLWYDWSECWHSHVGFGIDDPYDNDLLFGRSYNQVIFANLSHDVTKNLVIGTEVSVAKTTFRETRPGEPVPTSGESVGIEFTGSYAF